MSKILGVGWWEVARSDRDSWKEGKYRFICDAVRRWGGPRPLWKKAFAGQFGLIVNVGVIRNVIRLQFRLHFPAILPAMCEFPAVVLSDSDESEDPAV